MLDNHWVTISLLGWNEDRFLLVLDSAGCRVDHVKMLVLDHSLRYSPSEGLDLFSDIFEKGFTAAPTRSSSIVKI